MAFGDNVQTATALESLLPAVTVTLGATPTVGNTLVLWHVVRERPGGDPFVTPAGWTPHPSGAVPASTDRYWGKLFYRVVQAGDPAAWTVFLSSGGVHRATINEFVGVGELNTSSETTGSTAAIAVSLTPTGGVPTVIFGGFVIRIGDTFNQAVTPDANTTELSDQMATRSPLSWLARRYVASPSGAYTVGGTCSESGKAYGAQAMAFQAAVGPPAPVAAFSGTPLSGDGPVEVDFTDDSSGTPTSWLWDFGDGDTSTSQNPSHIYTDPGVYTVELTATNAQGSDAETKTAYITVLPTTPGAVLLDVYDMTSGTAVYEGTITDATAKSFQAQDNGVGVIGFKLNRNSPNAGLVVADRLLKIRIPQIHSDYIFAGFLDAPTATVISTDEQGGEELNVTGRGALAYWANAVWLSSNFLEPWWTCTDTPPSNAKGQLNVKANGGPQAGGKYRVYTVAGGVITGYSDETVGSDACWYFRARQTYQWPDENSDRFLVLLLTGPHAGSYFHPKQDGVTETLKTITIGDTIELGAVGGDAPGAVIRYMLDSAQAADRPINPLPLMTADFTDALDSDGNAWDTTDALAGITVDVHESYLETIGKLLATGVVDVEMGPDLDMHAYNAPRGRDLTSATFAANKVRFVKGVNIADKLDRQARDAQVATFSEVAGTDDVFVDVTLPSPSGRVPREVGIRGDTNDETALEALGLADLNARLDHAEAIGFNVTLPRPGVSPDESIGLYLPGPRYSDNGSYWVGDTIRLHTGTDPHDFDEADAVVAAITLSEDDGGNLRCTVELGTGLGPRQRGRYGSGLASSPGSTGASGSFVSRTSAGPVGAVEVGDGGVTDHGLLTGLADDDHPQYATNVELDAHTADTTDAHDASAVSYDNATSGLTAAQVQAAIDELADVGAEDTSLVTVAATGASETIDCSAARTYDLTFNANCTLTLTGAVTAETHYLTVLIRESGVGGWTITWPGSVTWKGTPITVTTADLQIVNLLSVDGGTNWIASAGSGTSSVAALDDLSDVAITTPAGGDNLRYRSGVWVNEAFEVGRWELVVTGTAPPVALTNDAEDDFLYALV